MENFSFSYREVIPDLSLQDEWMEINLNTGGTQSTLQDIKVAEKAGGYCFQNVALNHNRNRFIYWRSYQDILELSEISLDFNIYQNNLRYKFTDSPVLSVSIAEQDQRYVVILVTTVCSLHRINFPHPDSLADSTISDSGASSSNSSNISSAGGSMDFHDVQSLSIFREASANTAKDPVTFYVIGGQNASNNPVPHAACSILSQNGDEAFFALACNTQLMLYIMNCATGQTLIHQLKEQNIMPRLLSNLKGALIGKNHHGESENATSLLFSQIYGQIYLLALYRDDYLRMFSATTLQCVSSISCIRDGSIPRMQGPQCNSLRKISDTSMCAFLSHSSGAEFVCIDILSVNVPSPNSFELMRRKVIAAPQLDLADFEVSPSRIWALWCNAEGVFNISNFSLISGMGINWMTAAMEPPPDRYSVCLEPGVDARECYCSYIFHAGKFDRDVIARALSMFRRSSIRLELNVCNMTMLKEYVCQAVEDELQNEVGGFEFPDEELVRETVRLWERFYCCCEQYHQKANQPTGLVILEPVDAVCIVKKNTFSMLRPCETLEHLMLLGDNMDATRFAMVHFANAMSDGVDLVNLIAITAQLEKWLPEDVKIDLDKKIYQLEMPNVIFPTLTKEILSADHTRNILPSTFLHQLRKKLQSIGNLINATKLVLTSLRMDNGNPESMQTNLSVAHSSRSILSIGALFGSHVGMSLLSETVRQITFLRYAICRNLLILQNILIESHSLSADIAEELRSDCMPDTIVFLQSYYIMMWISETPVNINAAPSSDASVLRLCLLHLSDGAGRAYASNGKICSAPLLRVFLNAKGLNKVMALYSSNFKGLEKPTWDNTLLPLTTIVSQLIWPVSFNFVFGEWLFSSCQHVLIENYVRILSSWCEWNICSRQFILAVTLLDCGESYKSYDLFLQSAKGVLSEQFLSEKILRNTALAERIDFHNVEDLENCDSEIRNQAMTQFYLKVIQIFEHYNALDHVISIAQVAIGTLNKGDPQLPMFQSIVFNNHLRLEHYEEAYHSLIYNAEMSRRKDCLRQLVVTLFNKKCFDLLIHFPYVGLHEEFQNIAESRARSQTMDDNHIYDFLYAFHVNNGNMRKASAVMYEQAMRLQLEGESMEAMIKRCHSLLICINALYLIDARYRWIVKPVLLDDGATAGYDDIRNDSVIDPDEIYFKQKVVVLEISDIKKELLQAQALVALAEKRKDVNSWVNAGPQELTILLSNCQLFTNALKLAAGFNLSLLPIFDILTGICVRAPEENDTNVWLWLQENNITDMPHRKKPADVCWILLEALIKENEKENSTEIRKTVVNKILSLSAFVPQWLYNDYKLANCPEMLRLFVKHNRLLEASELAQEMICAMYGSGAEYFSFKHSMSVTNSEMCLPVHTIDLLLHGLRLNVDDPEHQESLTDLEGVVQKYLEIAICTADDKKQMLFQMNLERRTAT